MAYTDTISQINDARRRILEIRSEIRELQSGIEPAPVEDYEFNTLEGPVRLSALFGDHDELFVVHNMGRACVYCTLWADGFNGLIGLLTNRAAFVLSSPDTPNVQREFANSRGWRFRMVSHDGTSFASDMGYYAESGEYPGFHPGVSVFRRNGDQVLRVSDTTFGPGDDFCAAWHLFDLMPEGPDGWEPKYQY